MQQRSGQEAMSRVGPRRVLTAFDRGQVPTITVINRAVTPWGVKPEALVSALQRFVDECFAPVWGTPCKLELGSTFRPGQWAMVFLDDAHAPEALGYHELTPDGLPLSKVFVRTILNDEQKVSVIAGHELAEMLVNPAINLSVQSRDGRLYAYEVCDAVEGTQFSLDEVPMPNFVFPAFFEGFRARRGDQFDYLNLVKAPFEMLTNGYMPVYEDGGWTQLFSSTAAEVRYVCRLHSGRRMARRGKPALRSIAKMEEVPLVKCVLKLTTHGEGLITSGLIHRRGMEEPYDHKVVFLTRASSAELALPPGKYDYRFIAGSDSGELQMRAEDASGEVTSGPTPFHAGVPNTFHFEVLS